MTTILITLKYLGMVLVFVSCTVAGSLLATSEKRRLERSEALKALLSHITREIEHFRTPLDTVFASFANEALEKTGFLRDLRENSLSHALLKSGNIFAYSEDTFAAIINFSELLGKSEYNDQVARCKHMLSVLEEDLKKRREEYPKNKKMYTSLGVLSGLMIIVLFM